MTSWNARASATEVVQALGPNAKGKTYVVTGPSEKSIGASVATSLARAGASHIILLGRSLAKIQPVTVDIETIDASVKASWVFVDFLDNNTVYKAVEEVQRLTSQMDGLVNCAGIMAPRDFRLSKDGIESQFASNHVGHFLLTNLLMPQIKAAKGVIVNVASTGYELGGVRFDDINFNNGKDYNGWLGYAQSKTANMLFAISLAAKFKADGVSAFSLQPGSVPDSGLKAASGITADFMREAYDRYSKANNGKVAKGEASSLDQGAATIVLALLDPALKEHSGAFLESCKVNEDVKEYASSAENAERLWKLSENLIGRQF